MMARLANGHAESGRVLVSRRQQGGRNWLAPTDSQAAAPGRKLPAAKVQSHRPRYVS
jgi:hypothetical protein